MAQRLPIPGSDKGQWGSVLNGFLSESLAPDGTLKPNVVSEQQIKDGAVTGAKIASVPQAKVTGL